MKASNVYFTNCMCYVEFPNPRAYGDTQYPYIIKGAPLTRFKDSNKMAFLINTTLFKLSKEYCQCEGNVVTGEGLQVFNESILPDMIPYLSTIEMLEWKNICLPDINNLLKLLGYSELELKKTPIFTLLMSLRKIFRLVDIKLTKNAWLTDLKDSQFIEATFKGIAFNKIMTFTIVNDNLDLFDIDKCRHLKYDYTDGECRIPSLMIGEMPHISLGSQTSTYTVSIESYQKPKEILTISEFLENPR